MPSFIAAVNPIKDQIRGIIIKYHLILPVVNNSNPKVKIVVDTVSRKSVGRDNRDRHIYPK